MTTILVDIGRRWIRLGLANEQGALIGEPVKIDTPTESQGLLPAVMRWAAREVPSIDDVSIAIAAPGPFAGDRFDPLGMGNWGFTLRDLERDFPGRSVLVHDVIAGALSILDVEDRGDTTPMIEVTPALRDLSAPRLYIQTGVGLGVSALIPLSNGSILPLSGEGGSATIAPNSSTEQMILEEIRNNRFPDPLGHNFHSAQYLLSAITLPYIYERNGGKKIANSDFIRGLNVKSSKQVTDIYNSSSDEFANEAMEVFAGFLGTFAGDMALTFRSYGGVYIGGPIVPFIRGKALQRFHVNFKGSRGVVLNQMNNIPVFCVGYEYNSLLGLCRLANQSEGVLN